MLASETIFLKMSVETKPLRRHKWSCLPNEKPLGLCVAPMPCGSLSWTHQLLAPDRGHRREFMIIRSAYSLIPAGEQTAWRVPADIGSAQKWEGGRWSPVSGHLEHSVGVARKRQLVYNFLNPHQGKQGCHQLRLISSSKHTSSE